MNTISRYTGEVGDESDDEKDEIMENGVPTSPIVVWKIFRKMMTPI